MSLINQGKLSFTLIFFRYLATQRPNRVTVVPTEAAPTQLLLDKSADSTYTPFVTTPVHYTTMVHAVTVSTVATTRAPLTSHAITKTTLASTIQPLSTPDVLWPSTDSIPIAIVPKNHK